MNFSFIAHTIVIIFSIANGSCIIDGSQEILMHQENMELYKKIHVMRQEIAELQRKVKLNPTSRSIYISLHFFSVWCTIKY